MKTFQAASIALLTFGTFTTASFDLNTQGPDWSYAAEKLASTTSQRCKDAYSASISCDYTLVGLVASMRPGFKPTESDLAKTFTDECKQALDKYTQNLEQECSSEGDRFLVDKGSSDESSASIATIGYIFQYRFAQASKKNGSGQYCYTNHDSYPGARDLSCSDECNIAFFQVAHDYKGFAYQFNYYAPTTQTTWWLEEYDKAFEKVKQCGKAKNAEKPAGWKGLLVANGVKTIERQDVGNFVGDVGSGSGTETDSVRSSSTSASTASNLPKLTGVSTAAPISTAISSTTPTLSTPPTLSTSASSSQAVSTNGATRRLDTAQSNCLSVGGLVAIVLAYI